MLCARQRVANQDAAAGSLEELKRIVKQIRKAWPKVRIVLRADSGVCRDELLSCCQQQRLDYVVGLARNPFRRFNENSVDLNRNFLGPGESYRGAPPGYDKLDPFVNPPSPPGCDLYYARVLWLIARHGMSPLKVCRFSRNGRVGAPR